MDLHKAIPVGGLTSKKLQEATASAADVLYGKTFYAQDREIKTGTMNALHYVISESFKGNVLKVSDVVKMPAGKYRLDYALACRRYANHNQVADVTVISSGKTVAAISGNTFWYDVDGSNGICFNFGSLELTLTEDGDTYIQVDTTTENTKNVWNTQCCFSMYRIGE